MRLKGPTLILMCSVNDPEVVRSCRYLWSQYCRLPCCFFFLAVHSFPNGLKCGRVSRQTTLPFPATVLAAAISWRTRQRELIKNRPITRQPIKIGCLLSHDTPSLSLWKGRRRGGRGGGGGQGGGGGGGRLERGGSLKKKRKKCHGGKKIGGKVSGFWFRCVWRRWAGSTRGGQTPRRGGRWALGGTNEWVIVATWCCADPR